MSAIAPDVGDQPGGLSGAGTFAAWLRARSDDDLVALAADRPDLVTPVPPDLDVLAARAGARASVLRAMERLDRASAEVLEGLCLLDGRASRADLTGLLRADPGPRLDRLRTLALVWGDDEHLQAPRSVQVLLADHPLGLGRPFARCLESYGRPRQAVLATSLGFPPPMGEAGLAGELAELFADPQRLDGVVEQCTPAARALLERLSAGPPFGTTAPGAALRPVEAADAKSPVEELLARGLLIGVGPDTAELPREVGLLLRGDRPAGPLHPAPPDLTGTDVGARSADEGAAIAAAETVRLVERLLTAWGEEPPTMLRTGGLGVRDLKSAARLLDVEERVAALLVEVVASAGLLDVGPAAGAAATNELLPTAAYDRWLTAPTAARWAPLAAGWLTSTRMSGLVGDRDDRGRPLAPLSYDLVRGVAPDVRRTVLRVLGEAPRGLAPTEPSLFERLAWYAPYRRPVLTGPLARWALEEAALLGVTGRGALAGPGRALLDRGEDAAADALEPLLPEPVSELLVQADLTAVAPGPLRPELARELALVADVESAGAATVYRFSEASVRRGLDAGMTADELHALLNGMARGGVPQTLDYLVDDVARRHGALRVGTASAYLRCDDPALLAEVLVAKRTQSLGLRRIAPTVLVCGTPVKRILEVLRTAGYSPVSERADGVVVLTRPEERRVPSRARTNRVEQSPRREQLPDLVRQLRRGDDASRAGRRVPGTAAPVGRTVSQAGSLTVLQEAVRRESRVWLGYVDQDGNPSERIVAPLALEGGYVRAFDERSGSVRTFVLHRVTGVAAVADEPAGGNARPGG